jgi:AraC-like DNA-binding protein
MLRMQDATDLILQTDLPIGKISEKLGFSNQLYFSTAYKKQVGITPSEMRKRK